MQKLNELGIELQSLKNELLKPDYPDLVKKALLLSAENMTKNDIIDVDLHLSLTDDNVDKSDFTKELMAIPSCLKTEAEMFVEFEKIREDLQSALDESEDGEQMLTSQSIVETDQIAFTKTFELNNQWVCNYFGQPTDEVGKLMVRNGFVEKFAVLRLSKILESFLNSEDYVSHDLVDCKATRVFYDVEEGFYGIHLMFYISVDEAENKEHREQILTYIKTIQGNAKEYMDKRMVE